jgi:hypothetical protein
MAVRDDFTAGEVLAAADLNDTFASKPPFAYGTATPSTTVEGFIWYDENDTPPAPKFWDGSAFETFGGGKVLQVVSGTTSTGASTTSTSYSDTNLTATITPTSTANKIIIWVTQNYYIPSGTNSMSIQLVRDSTAIWVPANAQFSGAPDEGMAPLIYVDSPNTTSATTYKTQFKTTTGGQVAYVQDGSTRADIILMEIAP